MMLDKRSVEMLLRLSDDQLIAVIKKLASDAGIDTSSLNISGAQIASIRQALSVATDEDLKRATSLIDKFRGSNGSR